MDPLVRSVNYVIVIPWARVVCLIYTPDARGPQARGQRVYISGEPQVPMVWLIYTTSCAWANATSSKLFIVKLISLDCGFKT